MNEIIKELINRCLEKPYKAELTDRVKELRVAESDFDDEFFESFTAESRRQIYLRLILWTGVNKAKRILKRRVNSEVDEACRKRLEFMIANWPPIQ